MDLTWVLIGASVTASSLFYQPPSPGEILAERLGAPVKIYAHAGRQMHEVMPPDEVIRNAAMVVSVDGFHWYNGYDESCSLAVKTANHLFNVRAGRPMILAKTMSFGIRECINPLLEARCTGDCILIEPKPFFGLHPGRDYMEEAADEAQPLVVEILQRRKHASRSD